MDYRSKITRSLLLATLLLAGLLTPAWTEAVDPNFSDAFEYEDSPTNHGWTLVIGSVQTSSDQAFAGGRSVLLDRGTALDRPLGDVMPETVGTISVRYYDSMLSGSNWDVFAFVFFGGGTCAQAGLGFYNPSNYLVILCGAEFASTVPRSPGWHHFEWQFTAAQLTLFIDGVEVASRLLSGETLSTFALGVGTEPGLFAYFDEVSIGGPVTMLASLGPARAWIGLINSDDQGTRFDLRVDVHVNDALISQGVTRCVTGVARNPSKAKDVSVALSSIPQIPVTTGNVLSARVFTRIGTAPDDTLCGGHSNAAGLRLYYDAVDRPSRIGIEISPDPLLDFFFHSDSTDVLNDSAPTATLARFKDSSSVSFAAGNPWKEIGSWEMTLP